MPVLEVVLDGLDLFWGQLNLHVVPEGTCELFGGELLVLALIILVEELTHVDAEFLDLSHKGLDNVLYVDSNN